MAMLAFSKAERKSSVSAEFTQSVASLGERAREARGLQRDELFGALYLLGCLNGLFGRFIQAARADGPLAAALSIDINVIVFFACFAGLSVMFSTVGQGVGDQRIRGLDIVVAAFFLILVALPIYPLSWVAVTGLSLYVVLCARDNSDRVRAAIHRDPGQIHLAARDERQGLRARR
jgi:hypothetical protein